MKMHSKKGFTIVELVIVIAVIAILAAVVIPTFSGIVRRANESAALQEARNEYTAYLGDRTDMDNIGDLLIVVDGEYAFKVVAGQIEAEVLDFDDVKDQYETEDLTKYQGNVDEYTATEDNAPVSGKTYYTKASGKYNTVESGLTEFGDGVTYYEKASVIKTLDFGDVSVAIYAAK